MLAPESKAAKLVLVCTLCLAVVGGVAVLIDAVLS